MGMRGFWMCRLVDVSDGYPHHGERAGRQLEEIHHGLRAAANAANRHGSHSERACGGEQCRKGNPHVGHAGQQSLDGFVEPLAFADGFDGDTGLVKIEYHPNKYRCFCNPRLYRQRARHAGALGRGRARPRENVLRVAGSRRSSRGFENGIQGFVAYRLAAESAVTMVAV